MLTLAAAAGTANFETSEAAGIKLVSRNLPGPTASLALVAKAGTRYEWVPGLAEALEKFAFRVCGSPAVALLTR
jgi:ubiquinol-cytochrome c reductase core subunit 2